MKLNCTFILILLTTVLEGQPRFGVTVSGGYSELWELENNSTDLDEDTYQWFWFTVVSLEVNEELTKAFEIGASYMTSVSGNTKESIRTSPTSGTVMKGTAQLNKFTLLTRFFTPRYRKVGLSATLGAFYVSTKSDIPLINESQNTSWGVEIGAAIHINISPKVILFIPSYTYHKVLKDMYKIGRKDTGFNTTTGGILIKF